VAFYFMPGNFRGKFSPKNVGSFRGKSFEKSFSRENPRKIPLPRKVIFRGKNVLKIGPCIALECLFGPPGFFRRYRSRAFWNAKVS
jgi:hypothetical protein